MIKIAILFVLAVVISILLGFNIGKKKGYINGCVDEWYRKNEWWRQRLPKEVYDSVMNPCYEKLLKSLFEDED